MRFLCEMIGPRDYDGSMTTDEATAAALQVLEQAMDTANGLIGELIRRLDDSGRPRLRVLSGRPDDDEPSTDGRPRLRVL